MSPHAGGNAPTSSMTRSEGPSLLRIAWYSLVRPVSPLKNTVWCAERRTNADHNVELRLFGVRPEKCCEGAAVTVRAAPGSVCDSHQSSSMMFSGRTPHASRCAPTPREVTNGTLRFLNWRMVG